MCDDWRCWAAFFGLAALAVAVAAWVGPDAAVVCLRCGREEFHRSARAAEGRGWGAVGPAPDGRLGPDAPADATHSGFCPRCVGALDERAVMWAAGWRPPARAEGGPT